MNLFGVHLLGFTPENGRKLLFTICYIAGVALLGRLLRWTVAKLLPGHRLHRVSFWTGQAIRLVIAVLIIAGLLSVWFDDPSRLATAAGLITAGIAVALQRVLTALAAYFVLLRGKSFNVGDRITMGGVRGDVVALDLMQTTIMEMGQPPGEQGDAPSMWVQGRQYTGRIVTITNDKIFDQPVYNYSREFPYIWEEMKIPISYKDNRARAEEILIEVVKKHTIEISQMSAEDLQELERRYFTRRSEIKPEVFWRLTDNWIELSVRFVAHTDGVRRLKDRMSREILGLFDESNIGIASETYEIVGIPPVRIQHETV